MLLTYHTTLSSEVDSEFICSYKWTIDNFYLSLEMKMLLTHGNVVLLLVEDL